MIGIVSVMASKDKPSVSEKSVLFINLQQHFKEQKDNDPINELTNRESNAPGLYDVIRLLRHAKDDKKISGIFFKCHIY